MTFDEWKDDYGLVYEPNYSEATEKDCRSAWNARDAEVAELKKKVADHHFSWAGCSQQLKDVCKDLEEVEQERDQLRQQLAEANHAHRFMSQQHDVVFKERNKLREQVTALQHTIDEEAKDYAQVIIERDRLRNHVLLLRSCVEQSTEYRTGNPAYEHALFATEPK